MAGTTTTMDTALSPRLRHLLIQEDRTTGRLIMPLAHAAAPASPPASPTFGTLATVPAAGGSGSDKGSGAGSASLPPISALGGVGVDPHAHTHALTRPGSSASSAAPVLPLPLPERARQASLALPRPIDRRPSGSILNLINGLSVHSPPSSASSSEHSFRLEQDRRIAEQRRDRDRERDLEQDRERDRERERDAGTALEMAERRRSESSTSQASAPSVASSSTSASASSPYHEHAYAHAHPYLHPPRSAGSAHGQLSHGLGRAHEHEHAARDPGAYTVRRSSSNASASSATPRAAATHVMPAPTSFSSPAAHAPPHPHPYPHAHSDTHPHSHPYLHAHPYAHAHTPHWRAPAAPPFFEPRRSMALAPTSHALRPDLARRHSSHPYEYNPATRAPVGYAGHLLAPAYPAVPVIGARAPISRTTKACNACRARKVRCDAGAGLPGAGLGAGAGAGGETGTCSRCRESGVACVYTSVQKKRGPCPGSARPSLSRVRRPSAPRSAVAYDPDLSPDDPRVSYAYDWPPAPSPGGALASAHANAKSAPAGGAARWPPQPSVLGWAYGPARDAVTRHGHDMYERERNVSGGSSGDRDLRELELELPHQHRALGPLDADPRGVFEKDYSMRAIPELRERPAPFARDLPALPPLRVSVRDRDSFYEP
ncbi:hypothetical protein Q5752_002088 [Cryptotrichosporon argae]